MSDSSVVVAFEGGLDMVTPVQDSAPGTLVDCLNYEVGPIKGYRRIDGYERFDGGVDGGIANVYVMKAHAFNPAPTHAIGVGSYITRPFLQLARVVGVGDDNTVYFVPLLPGLRINVGDNSMRVTNAAGTVDSVLIVEESMMDAREAGLPHDEYVALMYSAQAFFRATVDEAPARIAGIYRGRNRTYAIVDALPVHMDSTVLEDGSYVRIDGVAYRLLWQDGATGWFAKLDLADTLDTGMLTVTYGQLMSGTGSYGSVSGYEVLTDVRNMNYGQVFAVEDRYIPINPAPVVIFEDGEVAPSGTVRLYDGTQYSEHQVISYNVTSGSFDDGNAEGYLYISAGTASSGFTGGYPYGPGVILKNETGATTLANVALTLMPTIAGTSALRSLLPPTEGRRYYQWGTYNFKATRGHEFVYFASGNSRAGWIVDTPNLAESTWGIINTGADAVDDVPKYLAYHAGQRLLLAYANGSVALSAVADPLNFSGLEGAIEIGNGDNITGVLEASDDSTLIFGPRTIRRLIGTGTSLALRTISSETGAMDYSACVVAGVPIYINHNGMCTLDQTSAYGDFKNSSISGAIDPFFTPRVVQEMGDIEDGGVMCAFPVRAKNQYRVFLQEGSVVTMSLTAQGPQAMKGSYETADGGTRLPIAYGSSVSDAGHEYLLCVWDETAGNADLDPPNMRLAYRLDHGWGFDGETFEHYMDTAYMFNEKPQFMSIDKAVLYGMGYGEASLRLQVSGVEDNFRQAMEVTVQDISMPRVPETHYKTLSRVMGEVDHANWGRALKLRFSGSKEAGQGNTEPAHILQSIRLFVQSQGIPEN